MTIDELIQLLNASQPQPLTEVQERLLRSAWENKTYSTQTAEERDTEDSLCSVAGELWSTLSELWGEPISHLNLHSTLAPRPLTPEQQQLIEQHRSRIAPPSLEFPSGPVSLDSQFYIERPPVEELACAEITKPGCVLRIKAPRQMGKSSLALRILDRAASMGYRTASLDFQTADGEVFASLNAFLRWFSANVTSEVGLDFKLEEYWNPEIGSKVSCTIYFQKYLLEKIQQPIVLFLNEVNRIFEYPKIAEDFLPMLRYWHEQAKRVQIWQNLRIVVAYSTEIYIPLKINQSPFNIGLPLKLAPFTAGQVQELAARHSLEWTDSKAVKQLSDLVGGHPYLVRLALYHLCEGAVAIDRLLEEASTASGIYSEHLRNLLATLQEEPELTAAWEQVIAIEESVKLAPHLAYKLDSLGLVKIEGDRAHPSCELYRQYFADNLMPKKEAVPQNKLQELEEENRNLHELVYIDALTQLASRHYLKKFLETQWQNLAIARKPLSAILCDVDYFKHYNDTFGHLAGDTCLQQIAAAVREAANRASETDRSEIVAARYGGEEFIILLPGTDAFTAFYIADRIREAVKNLGIEHDFSKFGGFPAMVVTVSLGVACTIPDAESSPETLMQAADEALYEAKKQGRDRVAVSSTFDYGLLD